MRGLPVLWMCVSACVMSIALGGCIERTISITSKPAGALVFLNNEEVGRTPLSVPFTYYGVYDVRLEQPGYHPLLTEANAQGPWWEAPGPDLVAELVSDEEVLIPWHFEMQALGEPDDESLLDRARQMRALAQDETPVE